MTAFRDSIHDAAWAQIEANGHFDRECAAAILDMPEMQAIRSHMVFLAHDVWGPNVDLVKATMRPHLPGHVIDWLFASAEAKP